MDVYRIICGLVFIFGITDASGSIDCTGHPCEIMCTGAQLLGVELVEYFIDGVLVKQWMLSESVGDVSGDLLKNRSLSFIADRPRRIVCDVYYDTLRLHKVAHEVVDVTVVVSKRICAINRPCLVPLIPVDEITSSFLSYNGGHWLRDDVIVAQSSQKELSFSPFNGSDAGRYVRIRSNKSFIHGDDGSVIGWRHMRVGPVDVSGVLEVYSVDLEQVECYGRFICELPRAVGLPWWRYGVDKLGNAAIRKYSDYEVSKVLFRVKKKDVGLYWQQGSRVAYNVTLHVKQRYHFRTTRASSVMTNRAVTTKNSGVVTVASTPTVVVIASTIELGVEQTTSQNVGMVSQVIPKATGVIAVIVFVTVLSVSMSVAFIVLVFVKLGSVMIGMGIGVALAVFVCSVILVVGKTISKICYCKKPLRGVRCCTVSQKYVEVSAV